MEMGDTLGSLDGARFYEFLCEGKVSLRFLEELMKGQSKTRKL
jgi:hypothetical protein